jgi:hypothetical protein
MTLNPRNMRLTVLYRPRRQHSQKKEANPLVRPSHSIYQNFGLHALYFVGYGSRV